ncbi:hypothetical protein [Defluviicoccus vanus]|uniref:hypothetical protein n=1 Tax=Defluviicoccus vanus TaxID=111831 RepID=UPI001CBA62B6|nr:hypothetical protein [Defluviicoccus vanus]
MLALAIIGGSARNQRQFLLTFAANGGATMLTLAASLLANLASRSPSERFAHALCQ